MASAIIVFISLGLAEVNSYEASRNTSTVTPWFLQNRANSWSISWFRQLQNGDGSGETLLGICGDSG
ncbi:hypothetical protein H6F77_01935 [Microcoleus sp. FACHB-831]|nr:hypothetical protein [Microcoleus sp. FACHB-831]